MNQKHQPGAVTDYPQALAALAAAGVFKENPFFRDGHTEAEFAASGVDITGSTLTQREVSEDDRLQMFGLLLTAAAARGLKPAELLAIGMATVLTHQPVHGTRPAA